MHCLLTRAVTLTTAVLLGVKVDAETVPVLHPQGSSHGFLAVKNVEGTRIATGDATQIVHGDRVTSRVVLRFVDGSIDEDTTFFSQRGVFRLITDHHIQRRPSFPKPMERVHRADYVACEERKDETRSSRTSTRCLERASAQLAHQRAFHGA